MSVHGPLGATPQTGALDLRSRAPRTDGTLPLAGARARLGVVGLAGLLLTGLLIALAGSSTDSLLPESVRPIPNWLAGPFGVTGLNIGWGGVTAAMTAMFVCYVLAVRAADRLSGRAVLMTIAALNAVVLLAPPLLSTDVFSYQAYARMWATYGANPYLHGPHLIALDPVYPFIGAKWVNTPSTYGPVFTTISYFLGPVSIAASALAYKAIAVLSSLATVALVWNSARLRGVDPVKAAALVGLNPLIVVYGVGGGHNDLLMLAGMAAGVYALLLHRQRTGGALLMVAAGVKLTAGLLLPFAAAAPEGLGGSRRRRDLLVGAGGAALALFALGIAEFGSGTLHLPATLQKTQNEGDWHSIPGFISTRLGLGAIGHVTGLLLGLAFVAVLGYVLFKVWRGELDWIDGAAWAALAMLVTASSVLPWYVAWLMPLVALGTDRRLWRASLIITGVVTAIQFLGFIPHATTVFGL